MLISIHYSEIKCYLINDQISKLRRKRRKMRHYSWILRVLAAILLFIGTVGFVSDKDLPIMKGKKIVATVNNEPITLDEFNQELATIPQGIVGDQKAEKERISGLLKRLINTRLIIQEARRMGLDELKELKEREDVFARQTLRDELIDRHVKDIKPDPKEVEKTYRESVKEFKIRSILFEKEEDAKQMEGLIKAGMNFDETFKKFLSDKKGKGEEEGSYLKSKELLPEIEEAVSKMTIGSFSSVIKIKSGYVIFKLEDIRFPEDPEIRDKIKLDILLRKQKEAYFEYFKTLKKKYAKANEGLLKGLDFESKEPGFEKLVKDKRVLVEIRGEKPITVGEFSEYMKQQLFHGIERAVEAKRLNKRKEQVLDDMLQKRILRKEALRLGIDKTEEYKNKVKENENSLLFGAFVAKAVAPDIKLKEEELKAYYDQHIKEYTYPEMMKIKSLAFLKREGAEKAIVNLRKGTDFQWLKANAEGQVDQNTKGVLNFEGNLLTTKDLPENVQKAVLGAKSGDFRLLANPENYFYVLSIQEVIPPRPQPYPEAREQIAKKIYNEKLTKAVEDYAEKLRALSEVKIYLKEN
jgi:parvulin-like peptidyl-prolyl isomerase